MVAHLPSRFAQLIIFFCLVGVAGQSAAIGQQSKVDLILHSGKIYTANARQETVEAMAVSGDRILAVGSSAETLKLKGEGTRLIDLRGGRVLPGLHDSHLHAMGIVKYEGCNLDSRAVNLLQLSNFVSECRQRLQPAEGEWLSVRQWSFGENNLPAGGFQNVRQALDAAAPNLPVMLIGNDGHHHATNSVGLSLAMNEEGEQVGLSGKTLREQFPSYLPFVGVDGNGEPNGAINEMTYLLLGGPGIDGADIEIITANASQIPARLNSLGITSMQDAMVSESVMQIYDALVASGPVPLRISLAQYLSPQNYLDKEDNIDMVRLMADAARTRDKYAPVMNVNANRLKFFVDGVLEGNPLANPPTLPNAANLNQFHQPRFAINPTGDGVDLLGYVDTDSEACATWRKRASQDAQAVELFVSREHFHPGQCLQSSGVMYVPAEATMGFIKMADKAGFAVHFHAIGNRSVRTAVDAIASVTPDNVAVNRHSISHLQLVSDADIARLGQLKIPLAFTYAWARKSRGYDTTVIPFIEKLDSLDEMYDPKNYYSRHFYPANSIRKAGGILAAGSDAPVETDDPRPFENIEAAVTRDRGEGVLDPQERLDILDALDAYTINGARLLGQQALTGSLEQGKKADFILLDRDVIAMARGGNASEIRQVKVLQTWFDGEIVYEAGK